MKQIILTAVLTAILTSVMTAGTIYFVASRMPDQAQAQTQVQPAAEEQVQAKPAAEQPGPAVAEQPGPAQDNAQSPVAVAESQAPTNVATSESAEVYDYGNGLVVKINRSVEALENKYPGACKSGYCEIKRPDQSDCPGSDRCVKLVYSYKHGRAVLFEADYTQEDWASLFARTKEKYGEPAFREILPDAKEQTGLDISIKEFEFKTRTGSLFFQDIHGIDLLGSGRPLRTFQVLFTDKQVSPQKPDAEENGDGNASGLAVEPNGATSENPM